MGNQFSVRFLHAFGNDLGIWLNGSVIDMGEMTNIAPQGELLLCMLKVVLEIMFIL